MASGTDSPSEQSPLIPSTATSNTLAGDDDVSVLSPNQEQQQVSRARGFAICLSIWCLIFIMTCNVSLLSTIQSSIATELEAFSSASWFTSAFLIAVTSITPVAGRLIKIFTARVYLLSSIIIQSCGTLITSQARSLPVFLLGRAICGIGAAAITPIALILVTELVSKRRRGLFFGCVNTGYTSGVACGAIIAGALEPIVGWRAVFWFQIPIILIAAVAAFFAIPKPVEDLKSSLYKSTFTQKLARIDYFGLLSLIAAVVTFLFSLSSSRIHVTPIILSVGCLILFIFVEAKWASEPIVPVSVMRSRGTILTGLATMGLMTARWGILFYTPVYAISVRGWSQASAGLMLIPTNVGFALGGILVGWLHIRHAGSFYVPSLVTFLLFSISQFSVSTFSTQNSNIYLYVSLLFINGFVASTLLNYTLAHVLYLTSPSSHAIVIPLNTMFRSLSGSFGSSISGGIFLRSLQSSLEHGFDESGETGDKSDLIRKLLGAPALVGKLEGVDHEIAVQGYMHSIRLLFRLGAALALIMLLVEAGTGWKAPGSKPSDEEDADFAEIISPVISREPVAN